MSAVKFYVGLHQPSDAQYFDFPISFKRVGMVGAFANLVIQPAYGGERQTMCVAACFSFSRRAGRHQFYCKMPASFAAASNAALASALGIIPLAASRQTFRAVA
ncbi:ACR3 family arsenite efflux pump ArsB [Ensifer sp. 4252]